MKIQWNKVTWYSKLVALIIFIGLPFVAFWYGIQYGRVVAQFDLLQTNAGIAPVTNSTTANSPYYQNVSQWETEQDAANGFSIALPIDFAVSENYGTSQSTDWRWDSNNTPGIKAFSLDIPKAFQPQTNFDDASLTVGRSSNAAAVASCLTIDQNDGPSSTTSTKMINGTSFTVFHSDGVGAGNIYETTSYRTIHAGQCYAVEYTIHSSQIANYPASYGLKPFDDVQVMELLDRIVSTFRFS